MIFEFIKVFLDELINRLSGDFTLYEVMEAAEKKLSVENLWPHFTKFGVFDRPLVYRDNKIVNDILRARDPGNTTVVRNLLRVLSPDPQFSCLAVSCLLNPQVKPLAKAEILLLLQEHQFPLDAMSAEEIAAILCSAAGQDPDERQLLGEILFDFLIRSGYVRKAGNQISSEKLMRCLPGEAQVLLQSRIDSSSALPEIEILQGLLEALDRSNEKADWLRATLDQFLETRPQLEQPMQEIAKDGLILNKAREFIDSRLSGKEN